MLTAVFPWVGKASCSAAVETCLLLCFTGNNQGPTIDVIIWRKCAIGVSELEVRQIGFHRFCREHWDILKTKWLEDMHLHIVIQRHSSNALEEDARPINPNLQRISACRCSWVSKDDSYAILPPLPWLVQEGLHDIINMSRKLVVRNRLAIISDLSIEEGISKPSQYSSARIPYHVYR